MPAIERLEKFHKFVVHQPIDMSALIKYLIPIALLIWGYPGSNPLLFGQETEEVVSEKPYFYLTVMPLSLIDFHPRFRFGGEYQLNDSYSFKLDLGYGNLGLGNRLWPFSINRRSKNRIYEIRPELAKNYRLADHSWFYIAAEGFYIFSRKLKEDKTYFHPDQNVHIHYDEVVLQREKYGAHLKLGIKIFFQNDIFVDFYGGIGAARRFRSTTDPVNARLVEDDPDSIPFLNNGNLGTSTIPHLTLGFRLGIKIQ